MSAQIWTLDPKTTATEWCRYSCFVLRIYPKGARVRWRCFRDYFGLQKHGWAQTLDQAKEAALTYAQNADQMLRKSIDDAVHPVQLLDFALKKLGTTEEALRAEYIVQRDQERATNSERLMREMLKERPDLCLRMLEDARDRGLISQAEIDQGLTAGLFGPEKAMSVKPCASG